MAQLEIRRKRAPAAASVNGIPDKLYFRIGEVSHLCGLPTYVLRFWESEFPQLKPAKSGTGQRLYRQRDVRIVLRIQELLYAGGFTIPGARQVLATEQRGREPQLRLSIAETDSGQPDRSALRRLRGEMASLLEMLDGVPPVEVKKTRVGRDRTSRVGVSRDLFD